jgi:hypothetical protein
MLLLTSIQLIIWMRRFGLLYISLDLQCIDIIFFQICDFLSAESAVLQLEVRMGVRNEEEMDWIPLASSVEDRNLLCKLVSQG